MIQAKAEQQPKRRACALTHDEVEQRADRLSGALFQNSKNVRAQPDTRRIAGNGQNARRWRSSSSSGCGSSGRRSGHNPRLGSGDALLRQSVLIAAENSACFRTYKCHAEVGVRPVLCD